MDTTNDRQSLIVPIHIAALCVGSRDVNGTTKIPYGTKDFAEVAADFSKIPYMLDQRRSVNYRPNVTDEMLPAPFATVSSPLEKGIHLHWALPDSVSHGTSDGKGNIEFRQAPNRWLVVRIVSDRANPATGTAVRAWIVESDHLWDKPQYLPAGATDLDVQNQASRSVPVRIPVREISYPNKSHQEVGKVFAYEGWPATQTGARYLSTNTALGYGIPTYAAAYAHCRNVFGLHDPLGDLSPTKFPPATTRISYMVTGWYGDPARDPLNTVSHPQGASNARKLADIMKAYRWIFPIDDATPFPATTFCNGLLADIIWDPENENVRYVQPRPATPVEAAVGNTTGEALSALIASRREFRDRPNVERVLNALQLGLLQGLEKPDGLAKFEEALYLNTFGATGAGKLWTIHPVMPAGETALPREADPTSVAGSIAQALPAPIAKALTALNGLQVGADRIALEIETLRGQIFVDWYKYMILEYGSDAARDSGVDVNDAFEFIQDEIDNSLNLRIGKLAELAESITRSVEGLEKRLAGTGLELESVMSPRHWHPNEPVMLLSGADLTPSHRHDDDLSDDGRLDREGNLKCRLSGSLVKGMKVGEVTVTGSMLPQLPASPNRTHADILAALTAEALFVDPNQAWTLANRAAAKGAAGGEGLIRAIRHAQSKMSPQLRGEYPAGEGNVTFIGTAPSPAGFEFWSAPWIPLMMQWEVEFHPIRRVGSAAESAAAYPPDFIERNFKLHIDGIDLAYAKGTPPASRPQTYRGMVLLTHRSEVNIRQQIENFIAANPLDPHIPELREILGKMKFSMMAQTLDGFNQALLMRRQTLQLPVADPLGVLHGLAHYRFSNVTVRNAVENGNNFAPIPHNTYNPLRAGFMTVTRIRIVDSFGQVRDIERPGVIRSETMIRAGEGAEGSTGGAPGIWLPPRVTQPSRLLFRWLTADNDTAEMSSDPASSPVCGWVLFNHLDENLMIYDADGSPLGSLNVVGPVWQGAPGNDATFARTIGQSLANVNPHLRNFALGIHGAADPRAYLSDMLAAIDRTATMIAPGTYEQDQGLSVLVGRPLALVRASLDMELEGVPAINQSWGSFAAGIDACRDAAERIVGTDGETAVDTIAFRDDAEFTRVRFPVRLGDLSQVNDGLIGYFIDNGGVDTYRRFYAAAAPRTSNGVIRPAQNQLTVEPGGRSRPTLLTMLVDPGGSVHATTGFLPVKSIRIPPDMYSGALRKMSVTFLTAPILANTTRFAIPVSRESGHAWSWVTNDPATRGWKTVTEIGAIDARQAFSQLPQQISEGWLRLYRTDESGDI